MRKAGFVVVVVALLLGWGSPVASAATCDAYSNQADAQRAMDTRDADGDGINCESLPCPCLKPGDSDAGGRKPTPVQKPKSTGSCTRPQGVCSASCLVGRSSQPRYGA